MRHKQVTPVDERLLLTRQMAADYLSISLTTFKTFELSGDVKGFPFGSGKEKRYRRTDLDQLADRIEAGETKLAGVRSK